MLDEQGIERDPVPLVDHRAEPRLGLLGGPGPDDPEPVRDAVDVGVDRDRGDPVAEDEHAVRGLRAHAPQREEVLHRPRDVAVEPVEELPGRVPDHPGLDVVEPGRPDQRLDRADPRRGEAPDVGVAREKERARAIGVLVPRPLREDRPDQDLERVLRVVPQVRSAPIPAAVEPREAIEERIPVHRRPSERVQVRGVERPEEGLIAVPGRPPIPGSERSGSFGSSRSVRRSSPTR